MQVLTSPRNPLLKEVRKAVLRGSVTEQGFCVAEGFHLLDEALRSGCEIAAVFAADSAQPVVEARLRGQAGIRVVSLPADLFRSVASTETSQGVITLVRPPVWSVDDLFRGEPLVMVLDGLQDPGNAGTILRSAEAFGASGVALLKGSVNPYNPKCLRASAGSVFRVPVAAALEERVLLEAMERYGVALFALSAAGVTEVGACHFDRRCALIVGSEAHGIGERLLGGAAPARIPTLGVESLNAAMAASIALYEARRQRTARS